MCIDIEKQNCGRCHIKPVSEKERTGIILTYHDTNIYLCNDCAWELSLEIADAVRANKRTNERNG
jgi:Zn-finger protein